MLSVFIFVVLKVIMLSVVILYVVMLSVVEPFILHNLEIPKLFEEQIFFEKYLSKQKMIVH